MDLASIIGMILAWGAIIVSITMEGGKLTSLVNPSAFILVVGGTIGATMISVPLKAIVGVPMTIRNAFFHSETDMVAIITTMVDFAKEARKDGILSLESRIKDLSNKFLKMGIQLVVDGTPSEMVREILETEIVSLQERHKGGETVFSAAGGFAPTLGIIGTVIGLVNMLSRLSEAGAMGPAIASAFTATLYGICTANLIYLPIGSKLKARTAQEIITYDMIIEGILSIQSGDSPRIVEQRMSAFLPPKLRDGSGGVRRG
jgi:chemotaxis protein MotA